MKMKNILKYLSMAAFVGMVFTFAACDDDDDDIDILLLQYLVQYRHIDLCR